MQFRLATVQEPGQRPVVIFPISEEEGALYFYEGHFTQKLATRKSLADLSVEDLPPWLLEQRLPLTLGEIQETQTFRGMLEVVGAAYRISPDGARAEPAAV